MLSIANKDALEFLKRIDDESIDLIVTDVPYASLEKHRSKGTTTRLKESKGSSNKWFKVIQNEDFDEIFRECYRVLKPNSHMYVFTDEESARIYYPKFVDAKFKFWKTIIWSKLPMIGMGYHYRNSCERINFLEKGKRKLNDLSIPDVLNFKPIRGGYPTEKPVDLLKVLIEQSSNKGDVVLDPFFGSGSTLIAAMQIGRVAIGNDISEDAIKYFAKRVKNREHESESEWLEVEV